MRGARSDPYVPEMLGFVLGASLSLLALPIVWFAGSRQDRGQRLGGFWVGAIVNAAFLPFVLFIWVVMNPAA